MNLRNTIIYLIGIPAVGKYTVAKEIGRMTGAKVVDNQLINTPVYSVVGYDGASTFPFPQGAGQHIETIRRAVLTVIRDFCPPDDSFVFTNVLDARAPEDKYQDRPLLLDNKDARGAKRRMDHLISICRLPVDIPTDKEYLLCHVQRKKQRGAEIGSSPGNARSDGTESSRR